MEGTVTLDLETYEVLRSSLKKQSDDICSLTKDVADLEKALLKVHKMFSDPEVYVDGVSGRDVVVYSLGMKEFMELAGRLKEDSEIRIHVTPANYVIERKMVE